MNALEPVSFGGMQAQRRSLSQVKIVEGSSRASASRAMSAQSGARRLDAKKRVGESPGGLEPEQQILADMLI